MEGLSYIPPSVSYPGLQEQASATDVFFNYSVEKEDALIRIDPDIQSCQRHSMASEAVVQSQESPMVGHAHKPCKTEAESPGMTTPLEFILT